MSAGQKAGVPVYYELNYGYHNDRNNLESQLRSNYLRNSGIVRNLEIVAILHL